MTVTKKLKAFTIVETLVTLLAITIMLSGPLAFMYRSYTYSQFVKIKIISTGLSQEGLELATSFRNADLNAFQTAANSCQTGCMIDWDGVSSLPTLTPCTGDSCVLYKSSSDNTVLYRSSGDTETDYYRYVKFTQAGTQGYLVESITYSDFNSSKVEVNLKKVITNLTIK